MESVRLPIDIVPGTNPPMFRWKQAVSTPNGTSVVDHEAQLPVTVEVSVQRLIRVTKQLLLENAALRGKCEGMAQRIALFEAEPELVPTAPPPAATQPPPAPKKGK